MNASDTSTIFVPDALLALAKDARYVRQCDALLKEICSKSPSGLAWLLYTIAVVRLRHRTLGMEYCGIQVSRGNRLFLIMALSSAISMGIELYFQEPAHQSEELRGDARRRYFEQQRRAMIQRATSTVPATTTIRSGSENTTTLPFQSSMSKAKDLLKRTLIELSTSGVSDEGPHALPSNSNTTVISIAKWLVRFQLIHLCLTGNFQTWKRFGIALENKRPRLLANRPNLHRFVSLLFIQQAVATMVLNIVQILTRLWVQRQQQQPLVDPLVERIESKSSFLGTSTLVCSICKLPRSHPAAPQACGHVFCWKCLYQWVAVTRPECPLCRAPCKAQDIMALYHYRP